MFDTAIPPMPEHIVEIQARHCRLMEQIKRAVGNEGTTPSQAIMIMFIGDNIVKAGDIIRNGYYHGTNASYNLRMLEKSGYIERKENNGDRRQSLISLSPKGMDLCIRLRRSLAISRFSCKPMLQITEPSDA